MFYASAAVNSKGEVIDYALSDRRGQLDVVRRNAAGVAELLVPNSSSELGIDRPLVDKTPTDYINEVLSEVNPSSAANGREYAPVVGMQIDAGVAILTGGGASLVQFGKTVAQQGLGAVMRNALRSTARTIDSALEKLDDLAPNSVTPHQPTFASGSLGAARQWTSKREFFREGVHLPYKEGKIRFIPPEGWKLGQPLARKGRAGGFLDKFGNEWRQGASRTAGKAWEWDVQLGKNATPGMKWLAEQTTGEGYVNISWLGEVTH